ncbi:uncharacterized protein LOC129607125 [Condylostylus longicornis]|uniref:uncharacterized protein LOC129607125 n=1 Tax=Condylostylus longicornis TaxID=2530218 RepID=UPI00244DF7E5|nr:uncharacterized protein LOC129607125 [Condylostylus longicornis]
MATCEDQSVNEYKIDVPANNTYDFESLLNVDYSSTENSETDTEDEFIPEMMSQWDCSDKRLQSPANSNSNKMKVERRPTRKPDPKTCNRNALMARENRKKKKEYVQRLENSILQYLKTQKNLQKVIKKQAKFIQKIQNEKRYYKNILSNKSEILSLVNTIKQTSNIPKSSCSTKSRETPETSPTYSGDCFRSDSFSSETDYPNLFDDNLNDYNSSALHDSWDNLEYNNSIFSDRICDEKGR